MSKKSFVKGAAILAIAGLIVKVIGAVFRIPLTNIIGSEGMANYQVAYPIYAFLLVISTAGLPAAISRMVSSRVTVGDYKGAHSVFTTALKMLFIIGLLSSVILFFLSDVVAKGADIPSAALGVKLIAPSLFFVSVLSAYRGYFQGLQQMVPTATTQLIEQFIKLGAGLWLASLWYTRGVEYGAAGALLGVSISEVAALALIMGYYNRKKKSIKLLIEQSSVETRQRRHNKILPELVYIAVPITLGACIMPLIMMLDTFIINNVLASVNFSAYNPLSAKESFGVLTGSVNPLINMPAVLSLALSMSLIPAISEATAKKDMKSVSSRSAMGFKLSVLVGLPCAVGMFLLSENIIKLLYSSGLRPEELVVGSLLLEILSVGVLFLTILQTTTGIIQGAGKPYRPLINLGIGAVIKVVLSIVLIKQPQFNIYGAAVGTAVCYAVAALLNIFAMVKVTKPSISLGSGVIKPVISTAVMGAAVYLVKILMIDRLGNSKTTLIAILAAVIVYVLMLLLTGAITQEDVSYIPGGGFVSRIMKKLKIWRT